MQSMCRSLCRRPQALALGHSFATNFAQSSKGLGMGEIVLFRAMQESLRLTASAPKLVVEEYHGTNHQVVFAGTGTFSRANARCELSDLMVIVYDHQAKDARLTYIQAKSEKRAWGGAGQHLVANLEQWDLLARRPPIRGAPGAFGRASGFYPPIDLLSGSQHSSIGSFVFFLSGHRGVEVYYAAASELQRPACYQKRFGKLVAARDNCACRPDPECLSVFGAVNFGSFLFGLMIGTPILSFGKPVGTSCSWLAGQLKGVAAQAVADGRPSALATELAVLLDPDLESADETPSFGARTLMILGVGGSP